MIESTNNGRIQHRAARTVTNEKFASAGLWVSKTQNISFRMSKTEIVSLGMSKTQNISFRMSKTENISFRMSKRDKISFRMSKSENISFKTTPMKSLLSERLGRIQVFRFQNLKFAEIIGSANRIYECCWTWCTVESGGSQRTRTARED